MRELIVHTFRDSARGGPRQSPSGYEIPALAPYVAPGKLYGQHAAFDIPIAIKCNSPSPPMPELVDDNARCEIGVLSKLRGDIEAVLVRNHADNRSRIKSLSLFNVGVRGDLRLSDDFQQVNDGATQDESSF